MKHSLNIAKVGNKFAIVAGTKAILKKGFKTIEAAKENMEKHLDFYEYWAQSCSVSVQNSKVIEIVL
jgi:hypothetical protein